MSSSSLPFDLLGQVSPILAWAEGDFGSRLPAAWRMAAGSIAERERGWLLGELPTYSFDNVDDMIAGARASHRAGFGSPARLPRASANRRPSLEAPTDFDLIDSFRFLNEYFFLWNGTEPCIKEGRMEDLHELAIRLPVGHVVRHSHARMVAEGVVPFRDALGLPEQATLLPSNSFGMRNVIRQGLSESHLHMTAVVSAEETWANNLLKCFNPSSLRGESTEERRLLQLNFFAGRVLAVAVWLSLVGEEFECLVKPRELLYLMDAIYFSRSEAEEREAVRRLSRGLDGLVHGDSPFSGKKRWSDSRLIDQPLLGRFRFLRRWVSPTVYRLAESRRTGLLAGNLREGLRQRYRLVQQLHLAAHLRLVRLSAPRQNVNLAEEVVEGKTERQCVDPGARSFLHDALFRYIVCRTHHWQTATQQGQTTGLRHFRKYFSSSQRKVRSLSKLQEADLVFERLREWRGLRVLEGRVSPPDSAQDLVPWILSFARPDDRRIEKFGLVVHFKKEDELSEEKMLNGKAPAPVARMRWGLRRRRVRAEGMRLYRLLRQPTPVAPFVVGIDACNLELATPPEVFAPVFRFLRELPISTSPSGKRRFSPFYDLAPAIHRLSAKRRLGMTFHVGEDFRHLLSGLRAIHEVVMFLAPQPGDRLGHGTALALRPEVWLKHSGYQAVVTQSEWLDTLVWVHHFLGPGDKVVGELALEDKIQRLGWQIYSPSLAAKYDPLGLDGWGGEGDRPRRRGLLDWDWSPLAHWDAWTLRQLDPYSIDLPGLFQGHLRLAKLRRFGEERRRWHAVQDRVLRKVRQAIGSRNALLLLALYWLSPEARKQGLKTIVVDMKDKRELWLELCRRVEEKMKGVIRDREMVVEVNPSSNRIIGPMASYDQNHLFQLTLDEDQRLSRAVRVSVNTDNPAVCNTTLAHEHYLVGEILMKKGVPEAEVVKWLEWLRQNGEDYCFVRQLPSIEKNSDMRSLVEWLRAIRPGVLEAQTRSEKRDAFWNWQQRTWLYRRGFSADIERGVSENVLLRLSHLQTKLKQVTRRGRSAEIEELTEQIASLQQRL